MTGSPPLVLIVDDSDDMRDALAEVLEGEGYAVATARDGQEALDVISREGRPDAVLLDLKMRGMGGEDFLVRIRQDAVLAAVPVVVTSGAAVPDPSLGAQAFLPKPFPMEQLIAERARLIDGG